MATRSRRKNTGAALPGPRGALLPEIFDGERFDPARVHPQGHGGPAEKGSVHGTHHVCVPGGEAMERAVQQHQSPAAGHADVVCAMNGAFLGGASMALGIEPGRIEALAIEDLREHGGARPGQCCARILPP